MTGNCHRRADCRLCGGSNLELVLSLTPTPPANAFVDEARLGQSQQNFPLDLFLCVDCGHAQLLDVVDPALLFEDYVYVSGTSPVFVRHFEDYAAWAVERFDLADGDLVVDIGSNDGTLLGAFKMRGMSVLGVDPASHIAELATEKDIETTAAFFTPTLAKEIVRERGRARVVTANNVFAHADDLAGVVEGVRELLHANGVFVFEVSYLVDVYEKTLFDTVYHEHLSYHSAGPLARFFADNGMQLIGAERVAVHGGSLRGVAQLAGGGRDHDDSIIELIALERRMGLNRPDSLKAFAAKIDSIKAELSGLLGSLKADGKAIAAFGAPAKATTLMYHFGIGVEVIDFIVDDNPLKQGLFSPGMHIPVLPSAVIYERNPDILVLLAWNFAQPIIDKHAAFRQAGGRFVVPLPTVEMH